MYKLSTIFKAILFVIFSLAFAHWMQLEPGDSFFTFRKSNYPTLITIIIGAVISPLFANNARLKQWKEMYNRVLYNKWFLLASCVGLTAMFVFALREGYIHEAPVKTKILMWVGLLLFGIGGGYAVWSLIGGKKAPQYDADSQYLYLVYPFRRTPIEWKHITHFSIEQIEDGSYQLAIAIHIDNAEELMASETRLMMRKAYEMYIPKYGTPYFLPIDRCVLAPEQLLQQLNQELDRHKRI